MNNLMTFEIFNFKKKIKNEIDPYDEEEWDDKKIIRKTKRKKRWNKFLSDSAGSEAARQWMEQFLKDE